MTPPGNAGHGTPGQRSSVRLIAFALARAVVRVVASVPNGSAAMDAVGTLRPDVLVIDLMMPGPDGLEVCRKVKAVIPEIAVVIVTAFDDMDVQASRCRVAHRHSSPSMPRPLPGTYDPADPR